MTEAEKARLRAELRRRKAQTDGAAMPPMDDMGFPVARGGVSTNSQAVDELSGKMGSAMDGAVEGAKFGLGDNIAGLRSAILGNGYAAGRDAERERLQQSRDANPTAYTAGNILGATLPALAAGPFATGGSALGTAVRGLGIGAIEGGLHGAGNADGQDVAKQAIRGAVIGGGVGAAAPALVGAAGAAKNAIKDPITGLFGIANKDKANRAIAGAVRGSGKTKDDIAAMVSGAARDGQPEYRMMDALGVAGQRQASGIARSGGDAATEIAQYLEQRQLGQGERVGGFVEDAFGFRGKPSGQTLPMDPANPIPQTPSQILSGPQRSAAQTRGNLSEARGNAANAAYDAARGNAAPVDVRGALGVIDSRIGGMEGAGIAGDSIDGKLAGYRNRLAGDGAGLGDGVTGAELSDFDRVLGVKQAVQDDIGAAVRAGRNNEARELGKLVSELDAALEASSDMYRTANDGYREASKVIGAVDDGAQMATRGRSADNVPAFQAMNRDQQGAARIGYGDKVLDQLERVTAPTSNRAKPLQSAKRTAEADAMTTDPRLYRDRLARENEMWETQNRALGGSRTADNIADQNAIGDLAGGTMGAVKSAANLQMGDAAAKLAGVLGPLARGQTEATRQIIARALMSKDPARALAPALRQESTSAATRRALEALLRQPGRESIR